MDKHIDAMSRDELVAEVLEGLRPLVRLTAKQEAAHRAAPLGSLRARVLFGRESAGQDVAGRQATRARLVAEGRMWLVGTGHMAHHEA